jgi:hypothetical protein
MGSTISAGQNARSRVTCWWTVDEERGGIATLEWPCDSGKQKGRAVCRGSRRVEEDGGKRKNGVYVEEKGGSIFCGKLDVQRHRERRRQRSR